MTQGNQQQAQVQQRNQQQQQSPAQRLGQALTNVRKVQNFVELNSPGQVEVIRMLRQAGDLVWAEIDRMQRQQRQQ